MSELNVRLFGKLCIRRDGNSLHDSIAGKMVEIFCFVLLHRHAPVMRERLADLLWDDLQSRRHLRQTLCALRKKLHAASEFPELLVIKNNSVRLNPQADYWLDVADFESAAQSVEGISGKALTDEQARMLQQAAELYCGELLEGWYQDWCLRERERLQDLYVSMLLKLMSWCDKQKHYEQGLHYGEKVLRYDHSNERTHRAMMQLRYQAGDRTGALRQYDRCVEALLHDLRVAPSTRTNDLYEMICADRVSISPSAPIPTTQDPALSHLQELQTEFSRLLAAMTQVEEEMRREISRVAKQQQNETPPEQEKMNNRSEKKREC